MGEEVLQHLQVDLGVPDHALFAHLLLPRLELGLNQTDHLAVGSQNAPQGRQDQPQGDEGDVHAGQIQLLRDLLMGEVPGVGPLQGDHPLIGAQLPGQLAVARVHGVHLGGAVLEHTVGKTAGGGADVGADHAGEVQPKDIHGLGQLQTSPAHIGNGLSPDLDDGVLGDSRPGLEHLLSIHIDPAAHDIGLGPLAALRKSTLMQQDIQPLFTHASIPPSPPGTGTRCPARTGV